MNRHYCVRLVKFVEEPIDTNPVCGILGLPAHAKNAYICGLFCMPVVGGPREFVEPFEWASFDDAMADVNSDSTHKLGLSFDWPVPVEAVRWRLRLCHHYDGSRRFPASDLRWNEFRLYWLAALGIKSQCEQMAVEISQRLVDCDGLRMPEGYTVDQCSTYRVSTANERVEKAGEVDEWARMLKGNHD